MSEKTCATCVHENLSSDDRVAICDKHPNPLGGPLPTRMPWGNAECACTFHEPRPEPEERPITRDEHHRQLHEIACQPGTNLKDDDIEALHAILDGVWDKYERNPPETAEASAREKLVREGKRLIAEGVQEIAGALRPSARDAKVSELLEIAWNHLEDDRRKRFHAALAGWAPKPTREEVDMIALWVEHADDRNKGIDRAMAWLEQRDGAGAREGGSDDKADDGSR